ncbi:MAG: response regulator [Gammaproteobacteria bacterium]|nr:response regulator [Gammaproteobacteria bacterium]
MNEQSEKRILIVEDDPASGVTMQDYLTANRYEATVVANGVAMKDYLAKNTVDLLVLDINLPGESGLSLTRELRANKSNLPIIMVSAAGEEIDRVVGLEIGADDYLPKPVSLRELLARVRAMLRRHAPETRMPENDSETPEVFRFGPFAVDLKAHRLAKDKTEIPVTSAEFNLLAIFVQHPNQVLNRDRLMTLTKGYGHEPYDRAIDVRISRLRNKIETDPGHPDYIRTIRGEGYLFSPKGISA